MIEMQVKTKEEFVAKVIIKLLFHPTGVKIGNWPAEISTSTRHRAMEALCEAGFAKKLSRSYCAGPALLEEVKSYRKYWPSELDAKLARGW